MKMLNDADERSVGTIVAARARFASPSPCRGRRTLNAAVFASCGVALPPVLFYARRYGRQ